jgi:RimJ/RimL family protein N-acetyltransferase
MLVLRPFDATDFDALASWFADQAELLTWGGSDVRYPLDIAQMAGMLAQTASDPPARLAWTAEVAGAKAGHIQLVLEWGNRTARIARVVVAPPYREQGLGGRMLASVLATAFDELSLRRVELNVFGGNTAAQALYARAGFQHEGTRRSAVAAGEDRWDVMIMGMLRSDYGPGTLGARLVPAKY